MQSQKWDDRMIAVHFQGKPFNIIIIQVYAPTSIAKEAEVEWFYEDLPSRINTKKRCPFHHRGLEWKSRKSRDTWSKRQVWSWSTEWSRAKANRVLPREHTDHSKHPLPTTQENTHGHHQMVNTETRLTIFFAAENGEALYSQQKQDQDLAMAQIMNSLLPNSDLNWSK